MSTTTPTTERGPITIGIDIGQRRDPTAVCVLERQERQDQWGRTEDHYLARHLERLPLGTPYPQVARRLAGIIANLKRRIGSDYELPDVWLDATGVGQPIADILAVAGVRITPIYFTFGDKLTPREDGGFGLGKAYLVSRLQVLLQSGRVLLPKTREAQVLAEELLDYEIKVDQDGDDKYGAFRVGAHDDLATALGLALIAGSRHVMPGIATAAIPTPHSAAPSSFDAYRALSRQVEQAHAQCDQEMRRREAGAAGEGEGDDDDPNEVAIAVAGMPRSTRDHFNPPYGIPRLRW